MFLTTSKVAEILSHQVGVTDGIREWHVRRIFENGDLPEPPKFGGKRMVAPELLPAILAAIRSRGWLPEPEAAAR